MVPSRFQPNWTNNCWCNKSNQQTSSWAAPVRMGQPKWQLRLLGALELADRNPFGSAFEVPTPTASLFPSFAIECNFALFTIRACLSDVFRRRSIESLHLAFLLVRNATSTATMLFCKQLLKQSASFPRARCSTHACVLQFNRCLSQSIVVIFHIASPCM